MSNVTIPEESYRLLVEDHAILTALELAGVRNSPFWARSMEYYELWKSKKLLDNQKQIVKHMFGDIECRNDYRNRM